MDPAKGPDSTKETDTGSAFCEDWRLAIGLDMDMGMGLTPVAAIEPAAAQDEKEV